MLSFHNQEPAPITVGFVGGSLWTHGLGPQQSQIVRNLTSTRYNVEIPAGEKESLTYTFATELHPQDLRLNIAAIVSDSKGNAYTMQAFNETVSVVEAPTSLFDPQMYVNPLGRSSYLLRYSGILTSVNLESSFT